MTALTRLALRYRGSAAALLTLFSLAAAAGAWRTSTQMGYRAFLGESHPAVQDLDGFLDRFGGGLPILAGWSCGETDLCDHVFDPPALAMAHAVARSLEGVPGVTRVDSPATSPVVVRPEIGLPETRRIAPEGRPAADAATLARAALRDPLWREQLVSSDGSAGAIVVQLGDTSTATAARVLGRLREALAPFERLGFTYHLVGGPVEFVVAGGELDRNTARIVPLMVLVIAFALALLLRSAPMALATLATVGVAVLWTFGLMGWLGWPRTTLTQALTPLVLVIGVCDGIHIVSRAAVRLSGEKASAALPGAAADTATPCLMTTVTTAAGFASLAASPLEGIARFGALAALGTFFALVLCFSLLPLLLSTLPDRWLREPPDAQRWTGRLEGLSTAARRRRGLVLATAIAAVLVSTAGITRLRVEASFEDLYGEKSQVVRWAREFGRILRPPDTLEIALEPPGTDRDRLRLDVLDRVATALDGIDDLDGPRSILDPLRHLNGILHEDTLPLDGTGEQSRAASLLRLMRREEPGVVELFLAPDGALRLTFAAEKLPQDRLRAVLDEVHGRIAAVLPADWTATVTGPLAIVQRMIDDIRTTQLRSFSAAAALVFVTIALFFGSTADALRAMVPTALPVWVTLGVMGFSGIPLDVGTAMVAAVVLGLAVDDAIHLLSAVRRFRAAGTPLAEACDRAVRQVGRAIVITSLALATGFSCLVLSAWGSIARFGLVTGVAILVALAATLAVLPALLEPPRGAGIITRFPFGSRRSP